MSLPTVLPNTSTQSTAYSSDFEYRHKTSITGYEIYDLYKISHSNWFNVAAGYTNPDAFSIKVDTVTGVWSDNASTTDPLVDASNSTYVILNATNGDEKYRFTKPSYFIPSSGGGGTSTSGASNPGGSISETNGVMSFVIDSQSPSTDGTISYQMYRDGVDNGGITHTTGTQTTFDTNIHVGSSAQWKLRLISTTGLYQTMDLAVYNYQNIKKVFCNFW